MLKTAKKVASTPRRVAAHVYDHRGRYALVAGIIAGAYCMRKLDVTSRAEAIRFIEEKGLLTEFLLTPEDFAEMTQ